MTIRFIKKIDHDNVFEKTNVSGLFKYPEGHTNAQVQGAQKIEPRDVYRHTLRGEFCSVTPAFAGVNSADTCQARVGRVFKQHCSSGFTLVEILIAIFILSLVMATVYVSYTGTLKNSRQLEEEGSIYQMARASMDRIIKDLSSLQKSSDSFDLHAEKKKSGNHEFHSVSFWSSSHLAFGEDESEGRPAEISYYVQEDDDGKSFSLRRADVAGTKPDDSKKTEGGFIICKNIDAFRLTFYDAAGEESDLWSASSTPGQEKGKAPEAIKIELFLVNPADSEKPYKFMTKVFLPIKEETP
jgi:general secretion pathway protein J